MQDRPDAPELAAAVAQFLREELLPLHTDARMQFRLRVAMNALGMLEREARDGIASLHDEVVRLARHLSCEVPDIPVRDAAAQLNAALSARIRACNVPAGTLDLLLALSRAKLAIASPGTLRRYGHPSTETPA
jgi:hypothetical protein